MHWMRIDRYFSAAEYDQMSVPEEVQVSFMECSASIAKMLLQNMSDQCDVARDRTGLNVMAYNGGICDTVQTIAPTRYVALVSLIGIATDWGILQGRAAKSMWKWRR